MSMRGWYTMDSTLPYFQLFREVQLNRGMKPRFSPTGQLRQVEQQRDELAAACQWYSDNPDSPISALEHIRAALAKVNAIRKIAALQADLDEWKAACEQKHELLGPTKQDLQECQRQVLALEQERDALKADAERYRWLRDSEDSPLYYKPAGYGV
jgi:hypothetical protein